MTFLDRLFPISTPLPRPPVKEGVTRLCVAGFGISHHTGRARAIATAIAETYPTEYETWYYFDTRGFRPSFLNMIKNELGADYPSGHKSSPFCWLEFSSSRQALGGRDRLAEWALRTFDETDPQNERIRSLCRTEPTRTWKEVMFDSKTPGTTKTE